MVNLVKTTPLFYKMAVLRPCYGRVTACLGDSDWSILCHVTKSRHLIGWNFCPRCPFYVTWLNRDLSLVTEMFHPRWNISETWNMKHVRCKSAGWFSEDDSTILHKNGRVTFNILWIRKNNLAETDFQNPWCCYQWGLSGK